MNIAVFGLGSVGLGNLAYLSKNHKVVGYDIDLHRIQALQDLRPIYPEPYLFEMLQKHRDHVSFTHDPKVALQNAEVVILAVPTPENQDGSCNLSAVEHSLDVMVQYSPKNTLLVIRSTVPPKTNEALTNQLKKRRRSDIYVVSLPEFLSQGKVVSNLLKPYRLIVGSHDKSAADKVMALYGYGSDVPLMTTSPENAELIKYASNTYLANKISFINEMAGLAEEIGADIDVVSEGMGYDPRIGKEFLKAGLGFGGSCFPKDLKATQWIGRHQSKLNMIEATIQVNLNQVQRFMAKVFNRYKQLKGLKIAVLGLAFKGNALDVRNSPAYPVVASLESKGAKIFAYDPRATLLFFEGRAEAPCIAYADRIEEALKGADFAIICNDDDTIRSLTADHFRKWMKTPVVFDGRNLFSLNDMKTIEYHSVGRPSIVPKK